MKKINTHVFLGCILVVCVPAQGMLNSGRAAYRSAREKYRMVRPVPVQGTSAARDAKKRLLTTGTEPKKKELSVMRFEQPLEVAPFESTSAIAQQEKTNFLTRIKSWWYGISQPSQTLVLSEYRVSQMFNFVLSEMNKFRKDLLVSTPGQDSVFEQENKWLRPAMANFANKLNSEYRDVLQGQKSGYSVAGPVLLFIYDYLIIAMQDAELGDRLALAYVFSACDLLQKLRSFGVELAVNDKKIARNIAQIINERLMANPALLVYLENLNATREPSRRLSDVEMALIIKTSALLVSIDEVQSCNEIVSAVRGTPLVLSTSRLYELLKLVGVNKNEPVINLWKRANILRRTDQKDKLEEINKIILSLGVTDAYASAIKPLLSSDYAQATKLQEIIYDSYVSEKKTWSIEAYAKKLLDNKSKDLDMFDRREFAKQQEMMIKE